jgi:hypothetical protein
MHHRNIGDPDSLRLVETYLSFILYMQRPLGVRIRPNPRRP